MQVAFEPKERQIISGLLSVVQSVAISEIEAMAEAKIDKSFIKIKKDFLKGVNKLMYKFHGNSAFINVKKDTLSEIGEILTTVVSETTFENILEGEKPKMRKEDYDVCVTILGKVDGYLGKS